MNERVFRIVIADDHELIRKGLKQLIELDDKHTIVGEASDGESAVSLAETLKPDVVILDLQMPKLSGIEALKRIKASSPQIKVMLLTVEHSLDIIREAIENEVDAFLLKDSAGGEITDALDHMLQGDKYIDKSLVGHLFKGLKQVSAVDHVKKPLMDLSDREFEVLRLVARGCSNKEIAEILYLSEKTVKNYLTSVFRKIDVPDRLHAALYAHEHKIGEIQR